MNTHEDTKKKFLAAYDEYADAIYRHCFFRVFDEELAKDMVQDTFIKTWDYLARGKRIDSFKPFLYKVATNLIIDHSRKKKESSLDALLEKGFDPKFENEDRINQLIDAKKALSFLSKLDEKHRQAVTMRYIDELSPKEIAQITGESENTVSVRIHRGIEKLKKILDEIHED